MRKEAERLRREEEARKRAELTRRKLEGQEIVPGLFVGGRLAASNPDWISHAVSQSKLSAVLNCTPNVRNFFDFSATDSQSADADDDGQRELAELESLITTETQDIKEEAKDDSTANEGQNGADKVDAKKLVDLLTQEPDMPLLPIASDGQEAAPTATGDAQLVTQQPMTGEEVFFATLETMTDDAKLAILESIALSGDEPDAEALRVKQEEEEADRKSAELVKETENLIQRSKQRLTNAQQSAVSLNIKLTYERIAIDDNGGIELATWFEKAAAFIGEVRSRGEAVLVHCREGRSRSVTMCIAYMMIGMKMTLKDAMERVHEAVFDENVNTGFKRQLMDLDFDLHGSNSIDFHNRRSRAAKLNAPSSYAETGPSEPRKSKRTRTTRKTTSAKAVASSQASAGSNGGDGDEDDEYAPDEESFIPPSKIKAIKLVMTPPSSQTSSIGMDEDENESENPSAPAFSSTNPELTSNASKPRQHVESANAPLTAVVSEPVITVTKAKNNEMDVDESEIVDIETPGASSATLTSNESKMVVDGEIQAEQKPNGDGSATTLDVPVKPKAKPTSAPSTPKKSAKTSAATAATAKATASPSKSAGGSKKKTAAPTPQKNTLLNYFGAKKTESSDVQN